MSDAIGIAKQSAKGGVHLFVGISVSSVVSAVGVMVLMRLLTPAEYGLATIAWIAPSFLGLFRDWGVNSAMIKYVAQYRREENQVAVRKVMAAGLIFEAVWGGVLAIITFALAEVMATTVFLRPETQRLIEVAALSVLANAVITAAQSIFTGFERMEAYSATLLCLAVVKSVLAPVLVTLGYSAMGAVLGQTVAFGLAGLLSLFLLYRFFLTDHQTPPIGTWTIGATWKTLLRYGLPLSIPLIAGGFLPQFYNFLAATYSSDAAIGNYQAALNFSVLIGFFTTPVATVLFPAFAKLKAPQDLEALRTVFTFSVKYAAMLITPVTVMIITLAQPLVFTLVGSQWQEAPLYLALYVILFLYAGAGNLSLRNFWNGQGLTTVTMKIALLSLVTGLTVAVILIPAWGIMGLLITTLVTYLPGLTVGLWWLKRDFNITVDWGASGRIFLASAIAAGVTYLLIVALPMPHWVDLVAGGLTFAAAYLIAAPLTKAVTPNDVTNLKAMLSNLGPLSYVIQLPLKVIEKILEHVPGPFST